MYTNVATGYSTPVEPRLPWTEEALCCAILDLAKLEQIPEEQRFLLGSILADFKDRGSQKALECLLKYYPRFQPNMAKLPNEPVKMVLNEHEFLSRMTLGDFKYAVDEFYDNNGPRNLNGFQLRFGRKLRPNQTAAIIEHLKSKSNQTN